MHNSCHAENGGFHGGQAVATAILAGSDYSPLPVTAAECHPMKHIMTLLLISCLAAVCQRAGASADPIIDTAERYVRLQTQGLPGKVSVSIGQIDARTQLPPCTAHEAYTPQGARLWGKTNIGVRCLGPNVWSVLVPVQISVTSQYVTTARPLTAGQLIQPGDLITISGDLALQPAGVVTDPAAAVGKTLRNPLAAGQALRADQLLAPLVIRQGQTVRLISKGPGFSVSGEGKAINNAAEGQIAQIRMPSGQVVSGVAKADGTAEITN